MALIFTQFKPKFRSICGNCIAMTTGRESACCREHQKSCDKIPPAMSCITENENFSAVCTNPAVIETAFNQYLENEGPIDDEPLNEYVYNMHASFYGNIVM